VYFSGDSSVILVINGIRYQHKITVEIKLKKILESYAFGQTVSEDHRNFILSCMKLSLHGQKKIGCGVKEIIVERNRGGTRGFSVLRLDDTLDDFSYKRILPTHARKTYHEEDVYSAFRNLSRMRPKQNPGCQLHHAGLKFVEIYKTFMDTYNLKPEDIELSDARHGKKCIKDQEIRANFIKFHDDRATLIEVTPEEHKLLHRYE
jgi:hypothetical protein